MAYFFSQVQQDPAQANPNFFRGMKWGTEVATLPVKLAATGARHLDHVARQGTRVPLIGDTIRLATDHPLLSSFVGGVQYAGRVADDATQLVDDVGDMGLGLSGREKDPTFNTPFTTFVGSLRKQPKRRFQHRSRLTKAQSDALGISAARAATSMPAVPAGFDFAGGDTLTDESARIM